MRLRAFALVAGALLTTAVSFAEVASLLTQDRVAPAPRPKYTKLLVLGISDDRETRHRFEDKLVSHLRGQKVAAVTSYSIVEDLTRPEQRDVILAALAREKVDGVLTVRAVGLDGSTEADWSRTFAAWLDAPATIRELVERSIPVPAKAAKLYGAEISLWNIESGERTWSARSGVYKREALRKAASDLMQETIARLRVREVL